MSEQPTGPSGGYRKAAVIFIFVTVVIDVLGFGLVIPVLPKLVQRFMHDDPVRGAAMYGVFGTVWAFMQFLCAPLLGAISDRFGRRPVILISCFALGLDYVVMAIAPGVGWLLVGRIVSGICASSFSTSFAYVADVTPPDKRASGLGLMGAAFGVGFVLGPALGGFLGDINDRLPFWGAAALALLNACYGLFVLPESLPPDKRDIFRLRKANPVGSLSLLRSHQELLGLAWIVFLDQLVHSVLASVYVLYTSYRYGWSPKTVGLTLVVAGISNILVQGALVGRVVRRLGERGALNVGLICGAAAFTGLALSNTGILIWPLLPILALWGLAGSGLQGLMSQRVAGHDQGKLQGANGSIAGIAGLIGPTLFTQSFAYAIDKSHTWRAPGAPFFLAAGLLLLALVLATQIIPRPAGEHSHREPSPLA